MCAFPKLFNTFDKSFILQFLASDKGMTVTGISGPYESHNRSGWKPKHQGPGFAVPRWKVSTVKITVLGALNAWADVKIVFVSVVSFSSVNGTSVDQIFASCLVGICVSELIGFLDLRVQMLQQTRTGINSSFGSLFPVIRTCKTFDFEHYLFQTWYTHKHIFIFIYITESKHFTDAYIIHIYL